MNPKFFAILLSGIVSINLALAAPAPGGEFNSYVKEKATSSGRSEKEVRDEALETLRREGRISQDDLARIGRGDESLVGKLDGEIDLLRKNDQKVSLKTERKEEYVIIEQVAGDKFDEMKSDWPLADLWRRISTTSDQLAESRVRPSNDRSVPMEPGTIRRVEDVYVLKSGKQFVYLVDYLPGGITKIRSVKEFAPPSRNPEEIYANQKQAIESSLEGQVAADKTVSAEEKPRLTAELSGYAPETVQDAINLAQQIAGPMSWVKGVQVRYTHERIGKRFEVDVELTDRRVIRYSYDFEPRPARPHHRSITMESPRGVDAYVELKQSLEAREKSRDEREIADLVVKASLERALRDHPGGGDIRRIIYSSWDGVNGRPLSPGMTMRRFVEFVFQNGEKVDYYVDTDGMIDTTIFKP